MFEILVEENENLDGDALAAKMHADESYPGSDIIFTNEETGQQLEVSLKCLSLDQTHKIEAALARYPDKPIMTNDEMAKLYEDNPMVFGSGFSGEELTRVSRDNIDRLISDMEPVNADKVIVGGVAMGTTAALWPFVMAYLKGRITRIQLNEVFEHVLGKSGVSLVSRITYATVFGPLFAWYLLARGVKGMVQLAEPSKRIYIEVQTR
jgi:hypothetical protein